MINISKLALQSKMNNEAEILVVDVREPDEFGQDHIAGAMNWPLEQLVDDISQHAPSTHIIFVCQTGKRSAQACTFARTIGFTNTFSLDGGMVEWRN